jgi:hypothetical protein
VGHSHFTNFTPEAMRAFGEELTAGAQRRREHLASLFATARSERRAAEKNRRRSAARAADARKLFVSELRSGVHTLRARFELARGDMAADFKRMSSELAAAREAFQSRFGRQAGSHLHRSSRPAAQRNRPGDQGFHPEPAGQEGDQSGRLHGEKAEHSKKRHG